MSLNPDLTSCNYQDFLRSAEAIVKPAYYGIKGGSLGPHHGTYLKYFTNNFYKWLDTMWANYKITDCECFKSRYAHWNDEITRPNGITDSYHVAIKESKMLWAQTMHTNCGCLGDRPNKNNIINNELETPTQPTLPPPPPPRPVTTRRNTRTNTGTSYGSGGSSGGGY